MEWHKLTVEDDPRTAAQGARREQASHQNTHGLLPERGLRMKGDGAVGYRLVEYGLGGEYILSLDLHQRITMSPAICKVSRRGFCTRLRQLGCSKSIQPFNFRLLHFYGFVLPTREI